MTCQLDYILFLPGSGIKHYIINLSFNNNLFTLPGHKFLCPFFYGLIADLCPFRISLFQGTLKQSVIQTNQ